MKISVVSGKRPEFIKILLEGEEWLDGHIGILGRRPQISGLNQEECEEKLRELEYKGAKRFVIRRLAKRSHYSGELREALAKRFVSTLSINRILYEFEEMGYINDQEWCQAMVRMLQSQKNGPRSIALKLRMKGVCEELAEAAIAKVCDLGIQRENIQRLLASRYRSRDLTNPKEKQKVVAALVRKGYSFEEIFSELRKGR